MAEESNSNGRLSWGEALRSDFPASIIVFLVALPLCMGIAIASGAPPATGLITGIIGGLVVGFLSGSPLQVSGPAAGLFVIVAEIIRDFGTSEAGEFDLTRGLAAMGIAVLAAGVMQFVAGLLKFGGLFRAVSPAVIQGMLSGIGVLILASQFHVMVDDKDAAKGYVEAWGKGDREPDHDSGVVHERGRPARRLSPPLGRRDRGRDDPGARVLEAHPVQTV